MAGAPVAGPAWVVPADKIIPDGDIVVGDLLGQGGFGAVYKVQYQGATCVLKVGGGLRG